MRDLRTTRCWSVLLLLVGFLMAVSSRASLLEAQTIVTSIPLPAGVMPAEIRVVGGGFLLIHRGAFRGLTPAGGDSVELLDSNGTPIFRRSPGLDVADATYATLLDATVSVDGQIVASMVALRPGSRPVHVLVFYTKSASAPLIVNTAPVACSVVAPAPVSGVWCLGPDVEKHNSGRTDFRVLHRFSADGRLMRSIVERDQFPAAVRAWDGASQISADANVVVWVPSSGELVRFDEGGEFLGRTRVLTPSDTTERVQYVLAPNERLYSMTVSARPSDAPGTWRRDLMVVDSSGTWRRTSLSNLPLGIWLVGALSEKLVLWDRYKGQLLFVSP